MRLLHSLLYILFISNILYAGLQLPDSYGYTHYKDLWESQGYVLVSTTPYDSFDNQSGGNQYSAVDSDLHIYYLNQGYHANDFSPTATYDGYTVHASTYAYYETVYRFAMPCVEPTGINLGIYHSSQECNQAQTELSRISHNSGYACGCTDPVGLTALYVPEPLKCNDGYKRDIRDDMTFCYAAVCSDGFIDYSGDGNCLPDSDGDGVPDFPNETDDADADGIPDIQDPDSPFYGLCMGVDKNANATFYGKKYSLSYYDYKGISKFEYCGDKVYNGTTGLTYVDSAYDKNDKNPSCMNKYCYIHDINKKYFKSNPCEDLFDKIEPTCADDEIISGYEECKHNGIDVINDTIKCVKITSSDNPDVVKSSDCDEKWYESYNELTKSCMCDDGYTRSKWGVCSKNIDANATLEQKNTKEKNDLNDAVAKKVLDNNSSSSNSNSQTDNILSGLRRDLNGTNSLLKSILDKQDVNGTTINNVPDSSTAESLADAKSSTEVFNQVDVAFNTVKSDFDRLKANIDNGFTARAINNGSSPNYGFNFHGKNVNLDLCTSFSKFYPIVYFLFSMIFTILGLRFFYYGFTLKV